MKLPWPTQPYCRLAQGFAYLVAIMDWYSRFVITWELSSTLDTDFCITALTAALTQQRCEVMNTDQGAQFTSGRWINLLKQHHISISMDGKGRYLDNIFVERLWRSVKCEVFTYMILKRLNNYVMDYKTILNIIILSDLINRLTT